MKENDADAWELVNQWLLILRRHGIAVLIVHHARALWRNARTSRREDNVFWIIALDDLKKSGETPEERRVRTSLPASKPSRNTQRSIPAYRWHFVSDENGKVNVSCEHADEAEIFRKLVEDVWSASEIAERK